MDIVRVFKPSELRTRQLNEIEHNAFPQAKAGHLFLGRSSRKCSSRLSL